MRLRPGAIVCLLALLGSSLADFLIPTLVSLGNGGTPDNFAASVALFGGNHLVSGSPLRDVAAKADQGIASLFSCTSEANCTLVTDLLASDGDELDQFGTSVAGLGTSTVVVGSPFAATLGVRKGAVYLFDCAILPCTEYKLSPVDLSEGDGFGSSVAASGDLVAIGAPGQDNDQTENQGAVYVFNCASLPCTQIQKILADDGVQFDGFGSSVALDGGLLAVGSPLADYNSTLWDAGSAYIYTCTIASCTFLERLRGSDPQGSAEIGKALAVSAPLVVIGASGWDNGGDWDQGTAYVYSCTSSCSLVAQVLRPSGTGGDNFGASVATKDGLVFVGAPEAEYNYRSHSGDVSMFDCNAPGCPFRAFISGKESVENTNTGSSLAAAGDFIAVGARSFDNLDSSDVGAIFVMNSRPDGMDPFDLAIVQSWFESLLDTYGSSWNFQLNPCLLRNLECVGGKVTALDVSGRGPFPTQFAGLTSLTTLMVTSFVSTSAGTIPKEYASLTSLQYLDLQYSDLTGTFPKEWQSLASLTYLDLRWNQMTGTVPSMLGLMNLETIILYGNLLEGTIPSQLALNKNLKYLDLTYTGMTGTIPIELTDCPIERLHLTNNALSGTIPTQVGNWLNLRNFHIEENKISGSIPTEIALTPVRQLRLSNNLLTGSLPSELALTTNLLELQVDGNQLTGTIPNLTGNPELRTLILMGGNNFCPMVDYSSWPNSGQDYPGTLDCEACANFTCQNDGVCLGGQNELFTCECQPEFAGVNCEASYCKQGPYLNQGCACFSGFTGDDCSQDSSATCLPLPTTSPLSTEIIAEYISTESSLANDTFTFVIDSAATKDRYFAALSLNDNGNPNCSYPGPAFTKSFVTVPSCRDRFTGTFDIRTVVDSCDFTPSQEPGAERLSGRIHITAIDRVGQFRGVSITRTTQTFLNLAFLLPTFFNLSSSPLTMFSPIAVKAAITLQEFDSELDEAMVEVTTSVQWPYLLSAPATTLLANPSFAAQATLVNITCGPADGTDCLQKTLFQISNIKASLACSFDGNYGLAWDYSCRGEACPVSGLEQVSANFSLASNDLCDRVVIEATLDGELHSYTANDFLTERLVVVGNQRLYFKATLTADVTIQAIALREIRIARGTNRTVIFTGGEPVPTFSSLAISETEGTPGPNELGFSFLASYGSGPSALFDESDPSGVFPFKVEADLEVDYRTTFGRKRDVQSTGLSLSANLVLAML